MAKIDLFSQPGRFWRGNIHTHSNRSDGALSPEEVCRRYRAAGYDFLAVTDHFLEMYQYPIVDTTPYRETGFTTLLGAELHSGRMENGDLWHILAVGLPTEFAPSHAPSFHPVDNQETGPEIAARAAAAGAFVVIAHPQWSGLTLADAMSLEAAHAVEVYNHGCATTFDRPDGLHTVDLMLERGRKLLLTASDDSHFATRDHFGAWVMVKAMENDPDALLAALKSGAYYSTQGPEFHDIRIEENRLHIASSAVNTVVVTGKGCAGIPIQGNAMTKASTDLTRMMQSPWIRVTLIDQAGKRAWSNPIWMEW